MKVDLRFRQRIGSLLLDRVLRGKDQERRRQWERLVADRHLMLLHRLEQRALHLRRGAVDLVGENDVGEDRPALGREDAVARVVDEGADQVGGQQVGGELQPVEAGVDGLRQGLHRQRLGQAGHALEQDVPVGEQADQHAVDDVALADDDLADLLAQPVDERRRVLDLLIDHCGISLHSPSPPDAR
jgi:hypothetical protein